MFKIRSRNPASETQDSVCQSAAIFARGKALRQAGQLDRAKGLFMECVALAPGEGQYAASLAKLLTDSRAFDEALVYWHRAVTSRPGEARWLNGAGACLQSLGRLDEALGYFRRAAEAVPSNALYRANLNGCRRELEDRGSSRAPIEAPQSPGGLPPRPGKANATLSATQAPLLTGDAEAAYRRGLEAQRGGCRLEALAHYMKAVQQAPECARFHYKLATFRHLHLGATDPAQVHLAGAGYAEAVRLDQQDPRWHNGLGMYLVERGEVELAEQHLRRALLLAPESPLYRANLAALLPRQNSQAELQRMQGEAEQLRLALVQDPDHPDLNHRWAQHLVDAGHVRDALPYFDHARQLDAENSKITHDLAVALRQLHRAEQNYRQGAALADAGRPFLAEPFLRAATTENPSYSNWQAKLGLCFDRMGRYEEGLSCFRAAIEVAPNHSLHWYNAGVMLEKMGRYDEAVDFFARSGPVHVHANDASDDTPDRGPRRAPWVPPVPPPPQGHGSDATAASKPGPPNIPLRLPPSGPAGPARQAPAPPCGPASSQATTEGAAARKRPPGPAGAASDGNASRPPALPAPHRPSRSHGSSASAATPPSPSPEDDMWGRSN